MVLQEATACAWKPPQPGLLVSPRGVLALISCSQDQLCCCVYLGLRADFECRQDILQFATCVVLRPPVMMPKRAKLFVVTVVVGVAVHWGKLFCRVPTCKCLAPVHPPEAPSPSQAKAGPDEDFPVLGHPFNSLQEWDPSHEASLDLEHLWQIPPSMLPPVKCPTVQLAALAFFLLGSVQDRQSGCSYWCLCAGGSKRVLPVVLSVGVLVVTTLARVMVRDGGWQDYRSS